MNLSRPVFNILQSTVVSIETTLYLYFVVLDAVKTMLSMSDADTFTMVLEEDGSSVPADVMTVVIDDNEKIGTLMVLRPNQFWTPGSNFFLFVCYCCTVAGFMVVVLKTSLPPPKRYIAGALTLVTQLPGSFGLKGGHI